MPLIFLTFLIDLTLIKSSDKTVLCDTKKNIACMYSHWKIKVKFNSISHNYNKIKRERPSSRCLFVDYKWKTIFVLFAFVICDFYLEISFKEKKSKNIDMPFALLIKST